MSKKEVILLEDDDVKIDKFRKLFRSHNWVYFHVCSIEEFIETLGALGKVDYIFLDHALDGKSHVPIEEYNSGAEVARYLFQIEYKGMVFLIACILRLWII